MRCDGQDYNNKAAPKKFTYIGGVPLSSSCIVINKIQLIADDDDDEGDFQCLYICIVLQVTLFLIHVFDGSISEQLLSFQTYVASLLSDKSILKFTGIYRQHTTEEGHGSAQKLWLCSPLCLNGLNCHNYTINLSFVYK